MPRTLLLTALAALQGCTLQDAPEDLDAVFTQLWRGMPSASDRELERVIEAALTLPEIAALDKPLRGTQARLTAEDLEVVTFFDAEDAPLPAPDPAVARPMFLVEHIDCSYEAFQRVLLHTRQDELYAYAYADYTRSWFEDPEAFGAGEIDAIAWEGQITTNMAGLAEYVYEFRSDGRRVHLPRVEGLTHPELLMVRTWMPHPATWNKGNGTFDQDYQLEVYIPTGPDEILHLYPVWRSLEVFGTTMEADTTAGINLDQMEKWTRQTEENCAAGLP